MRKLLLSLGLVVMLLPVSHAQESELARIEEDWELVVEEPDSTRDAPQVTTLMTPFSGSPHLQLQINLNHALSPDFEPGGIQIRVSSHEELLGHLYLNAGQRLNQNTETIRWTTAVQKTPGGYSFGINNGTSISWGSFGGNGYFLGIDANLVSGDLSSYNPEMSVQNSGVGFAGNRLQSLKLIRVRYFYTSGDVVEQLTQHDVVEQLVQQNNE